MDMIDLAGMDDVPRISDMVGRLIASTRIPMAMDRGHVQRVLAHLIASPDGAVWVSRDGFLAGMLTMNVVSPVPIASEMGWFAADGQGLRLLRAFEAWAAGRGAVVKLSTAPGGVDLSRLGYHLVEQVWVR